MIFKDEYLKFCEENKFQDKMEICLGNNFDLRKPENLHSIHHAIVCGEVGSGINELIQQIVAAIIVQSDRTCLVYNLEKLSLPSVPQNVTDKHVVIITQQYEHLKALYNKPNYHVLLKHMGYAIPWPAVAVNQCTTKIIKRSSAYMSKTVLGTRDAVDLNNDVVLTKQEGVIQKWELPIIVTSDFSDIVSSYVSGF